MPRAWAKNTSALMHQALHEFHTTLCKCHVYRHSQMSPRLTHKWLAELHCQRVTHMEGGVGSPERLCSPATPPSQCLPLLTHTFNGN